MPSEVAGALGVDGRPRKAWLISPAIATVLFFAAQLFLALFAEKTDSSLRAASAEPTPAIPVQVRVVAQIHSATEGTPALALVPESEEALFDLFKKQGRVVFLPSEVDTVDTPEARFDPTEVGVISAGSKVAKSR
jgi:hypothetical protein